MYKLICDRCGKPAGRPAYRKWIDTRFHYVNFTFFKRNGIDLPVGEEFDLCGECAEKLWNWLHQQTEDTNAHDP